MTDNLPCFFKSYRYVYFTLIPCGTLKLKNSPAGRDWKFSPHDFVLLMNAFNFGPSFSTIALYSAAFDSDNTFLLMSFRNHALVSSNEPLEFCQFVNIQLVNSFHPCLCVPARRQVSQISIFQFQFSSRERLQNILLIGRIYE